MRELTGVSEILQECGGAGVPVTRGGYPLFQAPGAVSQGVDPKGMTADFCIVTRGPDANRNGCLVQITPGDGGQGLILDNFVQNPVVLLNHGEQFALPIGVSSTPFLAETKATATVRFSQRLPEAMQVFALIDEGLLKTASISYLPLKARVAKVKGPGRESAGRPAKGDPRASDGVVDFRGDRCIDFISNDLLEWSVVTIPADPGAVRRCLELGNIRGERLTRSIRQSLEPQAEAQRAFAGWTRGRDALASRLAGRSGTAAALPAKGAPLPLSRIVAEAIAPHLVPIVQRMEQAERLIPRR